MSHEFPKKRMIAPGASESTIPTIRPSSDMRMMTREAEGTVDLQRESSPATRWCTGASGTTAICGGSSTTSIPRSQPLLGCTGIVVPERHGRIEAAASRTGIITVAWRTLAEEAKLETTAADLFTVEGRTHDTVAVHTQAPACGPPDREMDRPRGRALDDVEAVELDLAVGLARQISIAAVFDANHQVGAHEPVPELLTPPGVAVAHPGAAIEPSPDIRDRQAADPPDQHLEDVLHCIIEVRLRHTRAAQVGAQIVAVVSEPVEGPSRERQGRCMPVPLRASPRDRNRPDAP